MCSVGSLGPWDVFFPWPKPKNMEKNSSFVSTAAWGKCFFS